MVKKKLLNLLLKWPSVVIKDQDLAVELLCDDQARYDLVNRALKDKVLARLKRGIYCILPPYQKYLPHTFEIAQTLYGPSYISLESALSRHGLIPEAVYATTSASIKRSCVIETFLGSFNFFHVPAKSFMLGVERIQEGQIYFLATPWKALADLCYVQKKRWKSLLDLCEDLRIEEEELRNQDRQILEELSQAYGSMHVRQTLMQVKSWL